MKKLILISTITLLAQTADAQLSLAPEAGFQLTDMPAKFGGYKFDSQYKPGFRLGVNMDTGITEHLHLQAGLFYSAAGYKMDAQGDGIEEVIPAYTLSINYLQIPLYLNYMTGKAGANRFFAGAGPYLAVAVNGRSKYENGKQEDVRFGKQGLKRIDAGVNINAGYMLSMGLYVRAHYSFGLLDLTGSGGDFKIKNNSFGLSLGYACSL